MTIKRLSFLSVVGLAFLTGAALLPNRAYAQSVTADQLQVLVPDEQDLQGFTRIRPAGEMPLSEVYSQAEKKWIHPVSPAERMEDKIIVDKDATESPFGWVPLPDHSGTFSQIIRSLYSRDDTYHLTITANVCDSAETAKREITQFVHSCSAPFQPGTFRSSTPIGEESWINPSGYSTLICRYGRLVVIIDGMRTGLASRQSSRTPFPPSAVEAVAYQILLQASRQAKLTGVSTQDAHVAVNGKPLDTSALMASRQVYVPVAEFAKAMGMQSQWNAKTGALTLTKAAQKPITLTAGSTAGKVGTAEVALTTPVLKEAGQPVMTLHDLLTLTGGRIVSQKGTAIAVKA